MPEMVDNTEKTENKDKPTSKFVVEALKSVVIRKRAKRVEEERLKQLAEQEALASSELGINPVGATFLPVFSPPSKKRRKALQRRDSALVRPLFVDTSSEQFLPSFDTFSNCPRTEQGKLQCERLLPENSLWM